MIKRMLAVLLTVVSLCAAAISEPMFAYTPFPMDYLSSKYYSDDQGVYAYAPSTVFFNGRYHQFYCSNGQDSDMYFNLNKNANLNKSWDHIRYRSSKDGVNWSAPKVVMTVNKNGYERCACDPSVVYGDDGYWYMLYAGNLSGYNTVVFLARSNYIHGPYFKYTDKGWENENGMTGTPKIILGTKSGKSYGVGQVTMVKVPGVGGHFWVWYRDVDGNFRFASVPKLTDLNYNSYAEVKFYEGGSLHRFGGSKYVIGEVRLNKDKTTPNQPYLEMWCPVHYLAHETYITKFKSNNGLEWTVADDDELGIRKGKYRYSYIHNIGVSGDLYGRVGNEGYMVSFAAPSPKWNSDADVVLNACVKSDYDNYLKPYGLTCKYELKKSEGFNIVDHRSGKADMGGKWSMWQQLVGADWIDKAVYYPSYGLEFPHGVNTTNIDYFTGDYDGDGFADLGAVDRTTNKWYIYSPRKRYPLGDGRYLFDGSYIVDGEVRIPEMNAPNSVFEIIAGDYDGDGKTDIGAVNKATGQWYIRSSAEGNRKGIGSSLSLPNWIPWGWKMDEMNSSSKIIVGDYNGDGITDRAFHNGSTWYIVSSSATESTIANGFHDVTATTFIRYGWNWKDMKESYVAVPGDFDGDGITDRAFYGKKQDSGAQWRSLSSRLGGGETKYWGINEGLWSVGMSVSDAMVPVLQGKPFVCDFDGDGASEIVLVKKSIGRWDNYRAVYPVSFTIKWDRLKKSSDPLVLIDDFDGDYKSDLAFVDRATRRFYVKSSRTGAEGVDVLTKSALKHDDASLAKPASEKPIEEPKVAPVVPKAPSMDVSVSGQKVSVTNVESGSNVIVFNMLGKKVFSAIANEGSVNFDLPSRGKFIVRAGSQSRSIMVK